MILQRIKKSQVNNLPLPTKIKKFLRYECELWYFYPCKNMFVFMFWSDKFKQYTWHMRHCWSISTVDVNCQYVKQMVLIYDTVSGWKFIHSQSLGYMAIIVILWITGCRCSTGFGISKMIFNACGLLYYLSISEIHPILRKFDCQWKSLESVCGVLPSSRISFLTPELNGTPVEISQDLKFIFHMGQIPFLCIKVFITLEKKMGY